MRNNYFRSILLGAALCTVMAGVVIAESKEQSNPKSEKEVAQHQKSVNQTRVTIKKLAHGIDLWHDANLKGDFDKIIRFQNKIHQILRADIQNAVDVVAECEWQHELDLRKARSSESDEVQIRHGHENDDLKSSKKLIKAKEVLFTSVKRSRAFSNKYRLLNDYLDLLKKELGIERIELAEDFNQWDEDF